MSHKAQQTFCFSIQKKYPHLFSGKEILDVGSMDINGNNRIFFPDPASYIGLDIGPGNNVDVICPIHQYDPQKQFDVVISTECFEHDVNWKESIRRIYDLTKDNGMILLTIAGKHRPEHGTTRTSPSDSPYTTEYYRNITAADLLSLFELEDEFVIWELSYDRLSCDIRFFGLKKQKEAEVEFNPDGYPSAI